MSYSFLAQPPANAPKRRPPPLVRPAPPSSYIATWAANIQPGSPHVSLTFMVLDSPKGYTPCAQDYKPDLTSIGYSAAFLHAPHTPLTAALPSPARSTTTIKRLRSLANLKRPRSKSTTTAPTTPAPPSPKKPSTPAAAIKRNKARYAHAHRPPPLANDLALMQFADGGSAETNIKRLMEAQAKAAGGGGVGDVYRDGQGGVWRDADEEWEYAALLANYSDKSPGAASWVRFSATSPPPPSTPDSSLLNPNAIVRPSSIDDLAAFGSTIAPVSLVRPRGRTVLALPARSRKAKHLQNHQFLLDVDLAAWQPPLSPLTPKSPKSPKSPIRTCHTPSFRRKPRKQRPAPLTLKPMAPSTVKKYILSPALSPCEAERVKKEFLDGSFRPRAVPGRTVRPRPAPIPIPKDVRVGRTRVEVWDELPEEGKRKKNLMGMFKRKA